MNRRPAPFRRVRLVVVLLGLLAAVPASPATSRGNFDRPPFYEGRIKAKTPPAVHSQVTYRYEPGSLDPTPKRSSTLGAILDSLNAEIDRLGMTRPLPLDKGTRGAPDVAFGVRRGGVDAQGMPLTPDDIDHREPRRMCFVVEGPSKAWRDSVRAVGGDTIRAIVTVQLGFGEYWVRQKDAKGNKRIDLGVGRGMEVPWLTSLDDPVQVLQLTGALVSPEGRVMRVGAEGLTARRTGTTASMAGAQEALTDNDLRGVTEAAPGADPVWRTALRELVTSLLAAGP